MQKKKDSLMATFRSHKRKIKSLLQQTGAGSEDIYKPFGFAFETMDKFLSHLYDCSQTTNTETQNTEYPVSDRLTEENRDLNEVTNETFQPSPSLSTAAPPTQRR